ncbi:hypothetical protein M878_43930 [Streptomyces roseochromogenus subsp. oscitans DS 12.976]|uniref:Mutator family transposase n=1 Tax=Streptomyces roseochromogenus subsp. oscitans DS 12.976 TaxID=1352936 RepID=V6JGN5_STRRC|nr:hypothetical protein M878_43930 [Streptomyces roseochromogenus subsp. oscitans DS 12.976]
MRTFPDDPVTVIDELAHGRDETGRRLVVRNGYHQPRKVTTAAGVIEVKAPRVNDKHIDGATDECQWLSSAILPPWCRKSPKIAEVLPLLHLQGLSSGDFAPAEEQFLGSAAGLSPATVTRLTAQWQADGSHLRIRPDEAKAAVLVVIGVRADGTKELAAVADGYHESSESWAGLLRDCARRGMQVPVLAIGDGALGFWKALREVFPDTREQRCWVHKTANVLDARPKRPSRRRRRRSSASATPRTVNTPSERSRRSRSSTARSPQGMPRRSPATRTCCWSSSTQGHQGRRFPRHRPRHGLQARRVERPAALPA